MRSPLIIQIVGAVPRWTLDKPFSALAQIRRIYRPAFGAAIVLDMLLGDAPLIVANAATAFTIAVPLNNPGGEGTEMAVTIANTSGGALGAVTWAAGFKVAAGITYPATGNSRTYDFYFVAGLAGVGGSWVMDSSTADVPNAT